MAFDSLRRTFSAFVATLPLSAKIIIPGFVLLCGVLILGVAREAREEEEWAARQAQLEAQAEAQRMEMVRQFNKLTPAEHLAAAQRAWNPGQGGNVELAIRHLKAIPATSPEGQQAAILLPAAAAEEEWAQQQQEEAERARREKEQARREAARLIREQRRRDAEAEIYSYWPTTLRVDTDMDSFWLPEEERTCMTYPGEKGRIAVVACNPTGSHRERNIPVKFWGGVNRNTVSSWKCRRDKSLLTDEFVCRAID